ncbi:Ig-like domain-containing protein [Pedobacter xixiisoli]|nr:Ig-like domain-containing protein [Pedobacter xixiisoli]
MKFLRILSCFALLVLTLISCKKDNTAAVTVTLSEDIVILGIGEERQLSVTGVPAQEVVWSSSDASVATVSVTGMITAYKTGAVDIKATYKDATSVCKLSVVVGNYQKNWIYDFGQTEGNLSPTSAAGALSANDGIAGHIHALLPAPTSSQIARIWTGNSNVGGFTLTNTATIGSGARLLFKAPPSTSTSKFSILNIDGTNLFSIGYQMKLQAGTAGTYKFALGRDASTMDWNTALPSLNASQFSNNVNFSPTAALPVFLIMWWDITPNGYQLSIQQKDKSLVAVDATLNPKVSFVTGGEYDVQIYANNSTGARRYVKNNEKYSILPGASHIWINNNLLLKAAGDSNFVTSEMDANATLNAFMFMGLSNTNNAAQVYLDDFKYANYITDLNMLSK